MNIEVDVAVDFLWGGQHFIKKDWGSITYIVGANGTGKSIVAEKLRDVFKRYGLSVRYFGAERIYAIGNKSDDYGTLTTNRLERGFDLNEVQRYKRSAARLGQSIDGLIELRNKLDLQVKIESILTGVFGKKMTFEEKGGFLNIKMRESDSVYDLKNNESHGLKEIITLLAFLYDDEYNCVILDEPELNLHPQFQKFILNEIKSLAGNPLEEPGKKMFIILTHSPYMIDVQNAEDLKNVVVFHKNKVPTFINDYSLLEPYQLERLNKMLLRMNVNHKTFFFADKPVFVEGYTDQQIFNTIQLRRNIPLGALGVSIINVGGKDEVDIMFTLCRILHINAYCIVDLDAVFEGKLRQTANGIDTTRSFMVQEGRSSLMEEIGTLLTLINEVVNELESVDTSVLQEGELKAFIGLLKAQTGDNAVKKKQRLFSIGIRRIYEEIAGIVIEDTRLTIIQLLAIEKRVLECLKKANIYVLEKGAIENYYTTTIDNHYQISDANKTKYYIQESSTIEEMDIESIEIKYCELICHLDSICGKIQINTNDTLSRIIGNWIHKVQSVSRSDPGLTVEQLTKNPEIDWEHYMRIIQITDYSNTESGFCCKFKILRNLTQDADKEYSFDENYVAASFSV